MLSKVKSFGILGLEAYPVTIEIFVTKGLPGMHIVGLPDNAIRESKERIRSAIKNSGYSLPPRKTIINLSPANQKKEGPLFDLAMAVGLLQSNELLHCENLNEFAIIGELSLDGNIQPVKGVLSIAMKCKTQHLRGLIIPKDNALEASLTQYQNIYPVQHLKEAIQILEQTDSITPYTISPHQLDSSSKVYDIDFKEVKGQYHVKRGLEIAAAGGHNVLLIGPPGSGKSMMAKRIRTILPNLSLQEALETTQIHSVMGLLSNQPNMLATRPFRSPHHTTSDAAIVGGGRNPRPGEVTLSHHGVLFLDELPEFRRNVLEALRQPLEDRYVYISRASHTMKFPANFMLICAMNPCPCGYLTDHRKNCRCTQEQIQKYHHKISGPLLDRIDLHIDVPALQTHELLNTKDSESSQSIKERTMVARTKQLKRFASLNIYANHQMSHKQLEEYALMTNAAKSLLTKAIEELGFSARVYDKVRRMAQTIADLDGDDCIDEQHIAEAIQYRSLDQKWG